MIFACSDLIYKFERQTNSGIAINSYRKRVWRGYHEHDYNSWPNKYDIEISIMRKLFIGSGDFNLTIWNDFILW